MNNAEAIKTRSYSVGIAALLLLAACTGGRPAQEQASLQAPAMGVLTFAPNPPSVTRPGPVASISVTPVHSPTSRQIHFRAADVSHHHGKRIVRYEWDFGDGTTASGIHVTHHYTLPNTYTATLTLTDVNGHKDTSRRQIPVS